MSDGFTKGPWTYSERTDSVIAFDTPDDGGDIICCPPDADASYSRWPQNRRLIAAAPDLFEALTVALAVIDKAGIIWMGEDKARAALSRATPDQKDEGDE